MKKRYLYSFLFGIPGFLVSLIITFFIFGVVAGFLWLFIYGDNQWPDSVEKILPVIFIFIFLAIWSAFIIFGFIAGKHLEDDATLNTKHITASVIATIIPVLLIILHQLGVGNIGPKPDGQVCSDYCGENGYSGSGMPPRNTGKRDCICYNDEGEEAINIPIKSILSKKDA